MRYLYRKILLGVALGLFAGIAPLLILYAVGYRPSLSRQATEQIGVVLLETTPREVEVYVDGTLVGYTPRAVTNLSPGTHRVRLAAEGYVPWEKNVEVLPAAATELRGIRLFPSDPQPTIVDQDVVRFAISPDRTNIAIALRTGFVSVRDVDGQAQVPPLAVPNVPQEFLWAPDGTVVLLTFPGGTRSLLDLRDPSRGLVPLPQLRGAQALAWGPRSNINVLFLTPAGSLHSVNIVSGTSTLLSSGVERFSVGPRMITAARSDGTIETYNSQGRRQSSVRAPSDRTPSQIHISGRGDIALLVEDQLFLEDEEHSWRQLAVGIREVAWSPDGRILAMHTNQNELFVYNVSNEQLSFISVGQLHLVNRLSRAIEHPQWFAGGQHLVYQANDEIFITEIDTRDHPIVVSLDTTNMGDAQVVVGEDGERLYYLKADDGKTHLVMLPLVLG